MRTYAVFTGETPTGEEPAFLYVKPNRRKAICAARRDIRRGARHRMVMVRLEVQGRPLEVKLVREYR